jgi:hypothetical protein
MLGRKTYRREELDQCREAINTQLAAYRKLVNSARIDAGSNSPSSASISPLSACGGDIFARRRRAASQGASARTRSMNASRRRRTVRTVSSVKP